MSILHDEALFARTLSDGRSIQQLVVEVSDSVPSDTLLRRAVAMHRASSLAKVERTAQWLGLLDLLEVEGFTLRERVEVLVGASQGTPPCAPCPYALAEVWSALDDPSHAIAVGEALTEACDDRPVARCLVTLAASIGSANEPPREEWDPWISSDVPSAVLRRLVEAIPEPRRDAVLADLVGTPNHGNGARRLLTSLLPLADLATGPLARERVAAARELLTGPYANPDLEAMLDAPDGPERFAESGATARRNMLERLLAKYHREDRIAALAAMVERLDGERHLGPPPEELLDATAWSGASLERREAIARQVAERAPELTFTEVRPFADGEPIACFEHRGRPFRLVPGGRYDRGLSDTEEATLRAAASALESLADSAERRAHVLEALEVLLEQDLPKWRPASSVTVGPLLVAADPGDPIDRGTVGPLLEASPFRAPTETEWEYLARGGRIHELTAQGNELPDEALFLALRDGGDTLANAFGLWGFGLLPELCSDASHRSYEGAPRNGAPRRGSGWRICRGGAALCYPWQGPGWIFLLNAARGVLASWDYDIGLRPVIGFERAHG